MSCFYVFHIILALLGSYAVVVVDINGQEYSTTHMGVYEWGNGNLPNLVHMTANYDALLGAIGQSYECIASAVHDVNAIASTSSDVAAIASALQSMQAVVDASAEDATVVKETVLGTSVTVNGVASALQSMQVVVDASAEDTAVVKETVLGMSDTVNGVASALQSMQAVVDASAEDTTVVKETVLGTSDTVNGVASALQSMLAVVNTSAEDNTVVKETVLGTSGTVNGVVSALQSTNAKMDRMVQGLEDMEEAVVGVVRTVVAQGLENMSSTVVELNSLLLFAFQKFDFANAVTAEQSHEASRTERECREILGGAVVEFELRSPTPHVADSELISAREEIATLKQQLAEASLFTALSTELDIGTLWFGIVLLLAFFLLPFVTILLLVRALTSSSKEPPLVFLVSLSLSTSMLLFFGCIIGRHDTPEVAGMFGSVLFFLLALTPRHGTGDSLLREVVLWKLGKISVEASGSPTPAAAAMALGVPPSMDDLDSLRDYAAAVGGAPLRQLRQLPGEPDPETDHAAQTVETAVSVEVPSERKVSAPAPSTTQQVSAPTLSAAQQTDSFIPPDDSWGVVRTPRNRHGSVVLEQTAVEIIMKTLSQKKQYGDRCQQALENMQSIAQPTDPTMACMKQEDKCLVNPSIAFVHKHIVQLDGEPPRMRIGT